MSETLELQLSQRTENKQNAPAAPPPNAKKAQSLFEPAGLGGKGLLPEDLPYAAEVEAALARKPKRSERLLSLVVCLFIAVFIIWAAFAVLDEVTHAEGQVIASSRTQVIQNLEGGILSSIEVHEGQIVEKGAVLARLDDQRAESSLRDTVYKAMEDLTAIRRIRAVMEEKPLDWPDNYRTWLEEGIGARLSDIQFEQGRRLAQIQAENYAVQLNQRESEIDVLTVEAEKSRHEVEELKSRQTQLRSSLGLIGQQLSLARPMVEKKSYSKVQYLAMQERYVSTQGELKTLDSSIPKAESAAKEAELRIGQRKAEMNAALIEEINKRDLDLAGLRESLLAGGDRVTRTELRSPVRGTVKKIYVNTVGGVVKPGESIMEIVPLDDTLLIEAKVNPQDIAFLHPGQSAEVKVSAYDYSIYGGLSGVVEQLSADTIEDPRSGGYYYLVTVRTPNTSLFYRGQELPIMPGMLTTVDILTGKKSVLDYLLKPILKARQNALREK